MPKKEERIIKVATISNLKTISYIVLGVLLLSCTSNSPYNEYHPIENQTWFSINEKEFIVNSSDTISQNNVFINIRNNKDYPFSSLFLIGTVKFPSGLQVVDTLEYEMTDPNGNWLGTGFSDVKENKLYYKEDVVFSEIGTYNFTIKHATRGIEDVEGTVPLFGITDVGLSVEKIKK